MKAGFFFLEHDQSEPPETHQNEERHYYCETRRERCNVIVQNFTVVILVVVDFDKLLTVTSK